MGKGKVSDLHELKQEVTLDEHILPIEELINKYNTSIETVIFFHLFFIVIDYCFNQHYFQGLSSEKAAEILKRDGYNSLTPPRSTPEWIKFGKNLFGGFALLLWVCVLDVEAFCCFLDRRRALLCGLCCRLSYIRVSCKG